MTTLGGLPAHPLIIHLIVVLLPLATLGALLVAVRPTWRRNLGVPVFLLTLVGTLAVPVAEKTGEQLAEGIGGANPLVEVHEERAEMLLPYATLFVLLLLATLVLGRRTDRAEQVSTAKVAARLTTTASVLTVLAGVVVTALVIWIGDAGARAVWQGVGG